jgi:hypothetical protein
MSCCDSAVEGEVIAIIMGSYDAFVFRLTVAETDYIAC